MRSFVAKSESALRISDLLRLPAGSVDLLSHAGFTAFDPALAWSERICSALLPVARAGSPPSLATHDLAGSRPRFHTYLRDHVDALEAALAEISAAEMC